MSKQATKFQAPQATPTIGQVIKSMEGEIARALPKGMDADRMARLALTVVRQTPKLAQTTPQSFAGALLTASALGLEPGVNGEAYLVPYGRECQLIIGYQGMTKLFYQHPMASHIDAQAVHEHDKFDYAYGTNPFLSHRPALGERGEVLAYYAVATLTNGASAFVVLSPEEIRALRGGKSGPSGDIPDPLRWMERKTAIRQLVKLLPKSTQLMHAAEVDERSGSELHRELPARVGSIDTEHGQVDTSTGEITSGTTPPEPEADEAGFEWPPAEETA